MSRTRSKSLFGARALRSDSTRVPFSEKEVRYASATFFSPTKSGGSKRQCGPLEEYGDLGEHNVSEGPVIFGKEASPV